MASRTFTLTKTSSAALVPAVDDAALYLHNLHDEQRRAVMAPWAPLLIVAGAGTGKTRTLLHRVARKLHEGTDPRRILLLTFTQKAAHEMLSRLHPLVGVAAQHVVGGTFHHVALSLVRTHATTLGYSSQLTVIDREDALQVMDAAQSDVRLNSADKRFPSSGMLLDMVSACINRNQSIRDILAQRYPRFWPQGDAIAHVCRAYLERKQRMNVMDFDDLLTHWRTLLYDHPTVAEAIMGQFDSVFVDEYQDTNTLQSDIVDRMASKHRCVTVVGDDAQCIYGFRGARVDNMLTFAQRFPDANIVNLEENHRSQSHIVALADKTLCALKKRLPHRLRATRPEMALPALVAAQDDAQEAAFIAERILQLRDEGWRFDDIAVLYRAHRLAAQVELEFSRREIPFVVRSGTRFFDSQHMKDMLAPIRLLHNHHEEIAFRRLIRLFPGIGNATAADVYAWFSQTSKQHLHSLDAWADAAENIQDLQRSFPTLRNQESVTKFFTMMSHLSTLMSPLDILQTVWDGFYRTYCERTFDDASERSQDVEQLFNLAGIYTTTEELLTALMLTPDMHVHSAHVGEYDDEGQVVLTTVHQAKGLEWRGVFIIGLNDGLFPSEFSLKDGEEDEERRLYYVALTRARDELYCCYPLLGGPQEKSVGIKRRSRFIDEAVAAVDTTSHTLHSTATEVFETWLLQESTQK